MIDGSVLRRKIRDQIIPVGQRRVTSVHSDVVGVNIQHCLLEIPDFQCVVQSTLSKQSESLPHGKRSGLMRQPSRMAFAQQKT